MRSSLATNPGRGERKKVVLALTLGAQSLYI
jgi:hypothetical protein